MAARVLTLVHPRGRPSCVLLPGAGGGLGPYLRLAPLLGATHGVHVVRAAGLLAGEEPQDSIHAMAESAVEALDAARITPAIVLGWSLGGVVGWELCLRLAARDRLPDLVLVDSSPLPLSDAEPGLRDRIMATLGERPDPEALMLVDRTLSAQLVAARNYRAQHPYPGRVLLLTCSNEPAAARRWSELAPRLSSASLAADHYGVFDAPHLPELARHLDGFLAA